MQPFTFHTPTRVVFGADTASGVADIVSELGGSRPLVITDANLVKAGVLTSILSSLEAASMPHVIFDQVPPDSDVDCVNTAIAKGRQGDCDLIIAVGGGSVMDTAKAANIGLTLNDDILNHEGINTLEGRLLPLIAIPTTAGTGSEVSAVAMIKEKTEQKKLLFGSRFLCPDVAVLDPNLLLSLPPKLTAATGMDAMTHCIEAYVSLTSNLLTDPLCLEGMRLLFADLPRVIEDGSQLDARSTTLIASMMAGVAFTNSGVGIVHALAHTIGARFNTHHGMTNSVFLPHGMEYNVPAVASRYANAYRFVAVSLRHTSSAAASWFGSLPDHDEAAAGRLIEAVQNLALYCKLPTTMRALGVPELSRQQLEELADMAITDPAIMFNPREASVEDLIEIMQRSY